MNKKFRNILAVFGALSLALCWPLAIGQLGQSQLTHLLDTLSDQDTEIVMKGYQRGYLSSQMLVEVKINNLNWQKQLIAQKLPTRYLIATEIQHKMIGIETRSQLSKPLDGVPLSVQLVQEITLLGKGKFDLAINHLTWQQKNGLALSATQASLLGTYALHEKMLSYRLSAPTLMLTDQDNQLSFTFDNVLVEGNLTKKEAMKAISVNATAQRLVVHNAFAMSLLKATQLATVISFEQKGHWLENVQSKTQFDYQLMFSQTLSHFLLDWSLDKLDLEQLNTWQGITQNGVQSLATKTSASVPSESLPISPMTKSTVSEPSSPTNIDLRSLLISMGNNRLEAHGKLSLPTIGTELSLQKEKMVGEVWFQLSEHFSQSLPLIQPFINDLIQQGWLKKVTEGYQSHALLFDGQIKVNDKSSIPF